MQSLRGQLLIAPPHLADPNFAKAIVLIVQHDEGGAFGLVLNRPTEKTIAEVWKQIRGEACTRRDRVHVGGPVPGPLLLLHQDAQTGDAEVLDGVFCCAEIEMLEERVQDLEAAMRFYAGYAGWGGGQLEAELQTGSWLTVRASAEHVFSVPHRDLWEQVFKQIVDATSLPPGFRPKTDDPLSN